MQQLEGDCLQDDGSSTEFDPLDVLEYSPETAKRATHEALELTPGDGVVEVTNASYGDEKEDHTYTVHLEGGIPFSCSCPAAKYHRGACKHQVRVALSRPIIEAAAREPEIATDGGRLVEAERPAVCSCHPSWREDAPPCWPCYMAGFDSPNPDAEVSADV